MAGEEERPVRLNASQFIDLNRIGDFIRNATHASHRADAIRNALSAALRYRACGISWNDIATALGFTPAEVMDWLADAIPKPSAGSSAARYIERLEPDISVEVRQDVSESTLIHQTQSESLSQTMHAAATQNTTVDFLPLVSTLSWRSRCVVVLCGDPRPGGNQFGPETAAIRAAFQATGVEVLERSCIELTEITSLLAEHQPLVMHLAAHHQYGGVILSSGGKPLWTSHGTFAQQILRSPTLPMLLVLNGCESGRLAHHLHHANISVISWPGNIDDQDASDFARALYVGLARREAVHMAFAAAADDITEKHPSLQRPILRGPALTPIF